MSDSPTDEAGRGPGRPPLDSARLAASGADLPPGLQVEVVRQAGSTNALVAARARSGAPEGLVVVAEHQTAGRGRLDRTWETPAGSALTFSVLLRPTAPARSWSWLPLLAGYAVAKALKADGYDASVKWPNDVLLRVGGEERKVAGILSEVVDADVGPAAVVGIGLNVAMTVDELPVAGATSLAIARPGDHPDRTGLLIAVLQNLWEAYAAWQAGGDLGDQRLAASYAAVCATIGQEVRVDLPSGEPLTGRAAGIDPTGRLLVDTARGRTAIGAGDVVHVRAVSQIDGSVP